MIVKIALPQIEDTNRTRLTDRVSAGDTVLSVENGNGFTAGQVVVLGNPGEERTEAVTVASATDTTVTTSATKYGHSPGDKVSHSVFDKYEVSYKTTSSADWANFPSMPASLRWDEMENIYRPDPSYTIYSVRIRLYSTENTAYSNYSDEILSTGFGRKSVKKMTDQILRTLKDPEAKGVSRSYILQLLNEAQDVILAEREYWRFLLTEDKTSITTVSGTKEYDLPSDYDRMEAVYLNYVDAGTSTDIVYELKFLPYREFLFNEQDNNASAIDKITYYTITPDGQLKIPEPDDGGLSIYLTYYKKAADLDSDGDETDIPMPNALKYYVLNILCNDKEDEQQALVYINLYKKALKNLTMKEQPPRSPLRGFRYDGTLRKGMAGRRYITQEDRINYWIE